MLANKKNSTTLSTFAPPILFLLFDYAGVVLSEHLAFILRDLSLRRRIHLWLGAAVIFNFSWAIALISANETSR